MFSELSELKGTVIILPFDPLPAEAGRFTIRRIQTETRSTTAQESAPKTGQ